MIAAVRVRDRPRDSIFTEEALASFYCLKP